MSEFSLEEDSTINYKITFHSQRGLFFGGIGGSGVGGKLGRNHEDRLHKAINIRKPTISKLTGLANNKS